MTSKKDKEEKNKLQEPAPELPVNEQPESPIEETIPEEGSGSRNEEVEKPVQISSKQYVLKLKEEFKKEKISESVYKAFINSVPRADWEENYRLIWETTFRRPSAKK